MDQKFKKKPNCVSRKVDDELVIVPIKDDLAEMDYLYTLNETASFVWNRLDGKTSLRRIAKELTEHYDVDYDTASEDVVKVINEIELFIEPVG
jgi:hypothetical protein